MKQQPISDKDPLTPSTRKLTEMVGKNPQPRDLTAVEIELLRKSKQEIAQLFARMRG
jgi:hypothetical protein